MVIIPANRAYNGNDSAERRPSRADLIATLKMKVRVQFYGQLRETVGVDAQDFELTEQATVSDLLQRIYETAPALRANDKTILIGVGVEFVDRNYKLTAGDEVAIMPPVQGG